MAFRVHLLLERPAELLVQLLLLSAPQRALATCRDVPGGHVQSLAHRQFLIDLPLRRLFAAGVERFVLPPSVARDSRRPGVVALPGRPRGLGVQKPSALIGLRAREHVPVMCSTCLLSCTVRRAAASESRSPAISPRRRFMGPCNFAARLRWDSSSAAEPGSCVFTRQGRMDLAIGQRRFACLPCLGCLCPRGGVFALHLLQLGLLGRYPRFGLRRRPHERMGLAVLALERALHLLVGIPFARLTPACASLRRRSTLGGGVPSLPLTHFAPGTNAGGFCNSRALAARAPTTSPTRAPGGVGRGRSRARDDASETLPTTSPTRAATAPTNRTR